MIFIVGCGHTGTSLMAAVLDTHSQLTTLPGETNCCFNGELEAYCEKYDDHVVEKTPRHIYFLLSILKLGNKVIMMERNREDTVRSLMRRCSREEAEQRYDHDTAIGDLFRNQVCVVKYENLMADFEQETRRVLEYLDLEYEDLSEFWKTERNWYSGGEHENRRNKQLHQPIDEYAKRYESKANA